MELVRRLWWQVSLEGVSAPHSDSAEFAETLLNRVPSTGNYNLTKLQSWSPLPGSNLREGVKKSMLSNYFKKHRY